jgi:hypothetical protein
MKNKGSNFVPDPDRGINTREDLETKCYPEIQEYLNAYLFQAAASHGLTLVSVNPDGPFSDNSKMCYWQPRWVASRLIKDLKARPTEFDQQYLQFWKGIVEYRKAAWAQTKQQEVLRKQKEEEEKTKIKEQQDRLQKQMDDGC